MNNINTLIHSRKEKISKRREQDELALVDRAVKSARLSGARTPEMVLSSLERYIEQLKELKDEMQARFGEDVNFHAAIWSINREIQSAANSLIRYRVDVLNKVRLGIHGR